ncbi:MAG: hypothetical protein AB7F50_04430 [Fimbriimonadaceae bacterium]
MGVVLTGIVPAGAGLPQLAAPHSPAQQHKTSSPGVFAPIRKAKAVGKQANDRRADEAASARSLEDVGAKMGEALGSVMQQLAQALGGALGEMEASMGKEPQKVGDPWLTQGTVAWAHSQNGNTMVLLKRPGKDGWTDHFLFRGSHPSLALAQEGTEGRLAGKFTGKDTDKKNKVVNWILDDAKFLTNEQWDSLQDASAGGAAADQSGGEAPKESASFNSATRGWAFKGTVEGEGGRPVAVFEKPGEKELDVRLVRDGQLVEPGFRVLEASGGVAQVRVGNRTFSVTPW